MNPKLYNSSGQLLAVLDNIIKDTAVIKRVVNGEFTFNFSAYEKELKSEYFDPENTIVIDGQTFDIKYIEQIHGDDVKYAIQCEHVNYRMEDGEENLYKTYVYSGTPTQILTNILTGTEFSVGTIDFTDSITITVNAEITRKSLIYQLANTLGGELEYGDSGFTINILDTIGNDNGFQIRFGKNLKGLTKIIDTRGELKTYYSVDMVELKNSNEYIEQQLQGLEVVGVGDTIRIIDSVVGIDVENRILSIEYNPIFAINTKLEIANTIELIVDKIREIETSSIHQNKIYNGIRISAEEGYIAERSDEKAKTVMNATEGISIYCDTGSGLTRNFYVDTNGRIQAQGITINGDGAFYGNLYAVGGTFVGALSGGTISIGSGNAVFKADSNGIYLGNSAFESAPFRVSMLGDVNASNLAITGGSININSGVFQVNSNGAVTCSNINITGGSINISNSITIGNTITLGNQAEDSKVIWFYSNGGNQDYISKDGTVMNYWAWSQANFNSGGSIYISSIDGDITISAGVDLNLGAGGGVYMGSSLVATESWVSGNFSSGSHTHGGSTGAVGNHNHGIPDGSKLAVYDSGGTLTGYVFFAESGGHYHGISTP